MGDTVRVEGEVGLKVVVVVVMACYRREPAN